MEDYQIVELYFQRNTDAIKETDSKYGSYCFAIANNILHNYHVHSMLLYQKLKPILYHHI